MNTPRSGAGFPASPPVADESGRKPADTLLVEGRTGKVVPSMRALPAPSKIICVGRNYLAHAKEMGNEVPTDPLIFLKPPSALVTPGHPIRIPSHVGRVDFEGEIGVLMGRRASEVWPAEAMEYVAGLVPVNDVTARELQKKDSQWGRAKGFDTFCPVGPLVPLEKVILDDLAVVTRVNGEERQRGTTAQMVHSIPFLVSWVSRIMTLEPGDLLATGTPAGVGPLEPGDVVEVELEGLSTVRNPVERKEDRNP